MNLCPHCVSSVNVGHMCKACNYPKSWPRHHCNCKPVPVDGHAHWGYIRCTGCWGCDTTRSYSNIPPHEHCESCDHCYTCAHEAIVGAENV